MSAIKKKVVVTFPLQPPVRKNGKIRKAYGKYGAEVSVGHSIKVWNAEAATQYTGNDTFGELPGTKFEIGDWAEYGSYNLTYIGRIVQITEKTVTIRPRYANEHERNRRFSLYEFAWRNYDFDFARVERQNAEISRSI